MRLPSTGVPAVTASTTTLAPPSMREGTTSRCARLIAWRVHAMRARAEPLHARIRRGERRAPPRPSAGSSAAPMIVSVAGRRGGSSRHARNTVARILLVAQVRDQHALQASARLCGQGRANAPTGTRTRGARNAAGRWPSASSCSTTSRSASPTSERGRGRRPAGRGRDRCRSARRRADARGTTRATRRSPDGCVARAARSERPRSRGPSRRGSSGRLYNHRQSGASRRAQRAAVRQLPLLATAAYGVTRRSVGERAWSRDSSRSRRRACGGSDALREAREYTLSSYAHLAPRQRVSAARHRESAARGSSGHIGWFQEFWCRR